MSDPVESNYTNLIYADHTYGINTIAGGKDGFAPISGLNGHQIWETEHTGDDPGLGITAGLNEAQSIYDIVYIAQASAYHHWWTNATGGAGLLDGNWQTTKLFSAMAQFSKFIRPGWVAVGESDDNNGLRISAFKNPATGDFATVLVNTGSSAITETINLNGAYAPVLTPWVTTATLDVAQQQSIPATGNGSSFTYTIPAKSIVTLTGTATTTPVTEAPVGLLATAASHQLDYALLDEQSHIGHGLHGAALHRRHQLDHVEQYGSIGHVYVHRFRVAGQHAVLLSRPGQQRHALLERRRGR